MADFVSGARQAACLVRSTRRPRTPGTLREARTKRADEVRPIWEEKVWADTRAH